MITTGVRNWLILLLLLPGCLAQSLSPPTLPPRVPQSVIHFWASWCPVCVHELEVMQLQASYFKDHDIRVILVAIDDEPAAVGTVLNRLGITFPSIIDSDGSSKLAYAIRGLPVTAFVGTRKTWQVNGPVAWSSPQVKTQLVSDLR